MLTALLVECEKNLLEKIKIKKLKLEEISLKKLAEKITKKLT